MTIFLRKIYYQKILFLLQKKNISKKNVKYFVINYKCFFFAFLFNILKEINMHFSKLPFDVFMTKVAALIGDSLSNPDIVTAVSRFGYDKRRIRVGERVLKDTEKIVGKQNLAQERKIDKHEERRTLMEGVKKKYMKILQIARIAFDKDNIARKALQMDGARETSLDLWINQVSVFSNHLLNESNWLGVLKNYGINRKELNDLLIDVEKLRSTAMLCEKSKTEAKKLTEQKQYKIKELQDWVSDYLKIAKIALEDNPELYKKLRMNNINE